MRKFILLSCCIFGLIVSGKAQVDPLYAQYLNNPFLLNPAYAGLNNNFNASVSFRKQWAGFDGSPSTVNASAHTSLFDNTMGVGFFILQDNVGVNKNTEMQGAYAYRLDLGQKYFSFGLQAGLINYRANNDDLNPFDPSAPEFQGTRNFTKPTFGAGAILSSERYFLALSVPRMLKPKAIIDSFETTLYQQHFYLAGAYIIFLTERIRMKPSILFKGVRGAPLSVDYNFSLNIDEKYTVGAFTRNLETLGVMAQLKLANNIRFGYAFELPTNGSVGARFTSHELMCGINLSLLRFHNTNTITNF